MPLTCIGAAEHPHTEVRAGCIEAFVATPGRACLPSPWRGHEDFNILGPAIPGGALAGTKTR
jgi:hypothetical protein